jgi:hypothetical protein
MSYGRAARPMHEDGSITLPPNPFGTSATWADYDWRKLADAEAAFQGPESVTAQVLALIADAVEAVRLDGTP